MICFIIYHQRLNWARAHYMILSSNWHIPQTTKESSFDHFGIFGITFGLSNQIMIKHNQTLKKQTNKQLIPKWQAYKQLTLTCQIRRCHLPKTGFSGRCISCFCFFGLWQRLTTSLRFEPPDQADILQKSLHRVQKYLIDIILAEWKQFDKQGNRFGLSISATMKWLRELLKGVLKSQAFFIK